MKSRTITTIGIITAILMTVSGAELAFARGGGGKGGGFCNGKGPGAQAGAGMAQTGNTYQYRHKQQQQNQYRGDNGTPEIQSGNGQTPGEQSQLRVRKQLRDPDSHLAKPAE
jgi:hypothetical protein